MINSLQFGSRIIEYELVYVSRKTLGITVNPDLTVLVKAPFNASIEKIKEKVLKRAPWIIKQHEYFLSFHPKTPPRKFISGETHLYLGRQYRLNVKIGEKNEVKYKGRFIEVRTTNKDKAKDLVLDWYRDHAKKKFSEIAEPIVEKFKKYNVEPNAIELKNMPKRWGSCTPNGKIILNPELIKAPKACIEYVIIHELCHLIHKDHTRKFFELQSKEMPDWMKWKDRLERIMV
jgi:predicted metal-dependent hydrolase